MVKSLPAMQETQVQSLGGEGPLEKEMAIHSSILAWKIPWMEKPGRLQSMGSKRVLHDLTQGSNLHLQKKHKNLASPSLTGDSLPVRHLGSTYIKFKNRKKKPLKLN